MPNFPLPQRIRDHLIGRARVLASRPMMLALGQFPLSVEQVQRAIITDDQRERMQQLVDEGVQTIDRHHELRLALLREANFPGIRRSTVLHMTLPTRVFVCRATMYSISTTKFEISENHYLIPQFTHLDDREKRELARWVDRCVRQVRLQEIVNWCATQALDPSLTPTSSHLIALWPELATLLDLSTFSMYQREREQYDKWVERLRNPVRRNVAAYRPSAATTAKLGRAIEAANVQLAAGMLLNEYEFKRGQIRTHIEHWERLDNDLRVQV